jgi:TonB family protein
MSSVRRGLLLTAWLACPVAAVAATGGQAPASGGPLAAACIAPAWHGTVPAGAQASREQMESTQAAVHAFNDSVTAYTTCLKQAHDKLAADPALSAAGRKALDDERAALNNAAVAEAERVAGAFNEQLRAFRGESVTPPAVTTTAAEYAALHKRCYPEGFAGKGAVLLEAVITKYGRVSSTRVLRSGGSDAVDQVAQCMLNGLSFRPATEPVLGHVTARVPLTINVRP